MEPTGYLPNSCSKVLQRSSPPSCYLSSASPANPKSSHADAATNLLSLSVFLIEMKSLGTHERTSKGKKIWLLGSTSTLPGVVELVEFLDEFSAK